MKKNIKNGIIRQGDVLLLPIDKIPKVTKKTENVILAHGEITGHRHEILEGAVGFVESENPVDSLTTADYIEVQKLISEVQHGTAEEIRHGTSRTLDHSTIPVKKGKYEVVRQHEYTPAAIVRVAD